MKTAIHILCCILLSQLLHAQERQYNFRQIGIQDGLSQNSVTDIVQDSLGFLWLATQDGLNRYDGYNFKIYDKYFADVTRPDEVKLGQLLVDGQGRLWIIPKNGIPEYYDLSKDSFIALNDLTDISCMHYDEGKLIFAGQNGLFQSDNSQQDFTKLCDLPIQKIATDADASIWLISEGKIYQQDGDRFTIAKINEPQNFSCLYLSDDKNLYAGTFGGKQYVKTKSAAHFKVIHPNLNGLNAIEIYQDKDNLLWIATYGNGLELYDKKLNTTQSFMPIAKNSHSLSYKDVVCIFEDKNGTLFFGTDGDGFNLFDAQLQKFQGVTNGQMPKGVEVDVVRSIFVDSKNRRWIGTSGKGLSCLISKQSPTLWKNYKVENSDIPSNRILCLSENSDGALVVGTQAKGLVLYSKGSFRMENPQFFGNQNILALLKDESNRMWLSSSKNGLLLYDFTASQILEQWTLKNSALKANDIRVICEAQSSLWLGTDDHGLYKLDLISKKVNKIKNAPQRIKSLHVDGDVLWIGTNGEGLVAYHTKSNNFFSYTIEHGLPNNVIYGILPDAEAMLWLSTNKGLCQFSKPLKFGEPPAFCKTFDQQDGLQSLEFNTGAYFKDEQGVLYFGGLKGFNFFDPSALPENQLSSLPLITSFKGGQTSFINKIYDGKRIRLKYNQNDLSIGFAAINYALPERNEFAYQLIGYDEELVNAGKRHFVQYTNLPAGDYTFKVNTLNEDGSINESKSFDFSIRRHWLLSRVAQLIYLLLFIIGVFAIYEFLKNRWEFKQQIKEERKEAERSKKMDSFRKNLYTNITHELRTPLTVISGMANEIKENPKAKKLIQRNSNQLLTLVNQILDLSKMESGFLKVNYHQQDIVAFVKSICSSFEAVAQSQKLQLNFHSKQKELILDFDPQKLQQILINLIYNAIKYTPEDGEINILLDAKENEFSIDVKDNGVGIREEDLPHIFNKFFQSNVENQKMDSGSGIGLSFVKQLTELMNGKINVSSQLNIGTSFSLRFPIHNVSEIRDPIQPIEQFSMQDLLPLPTFDPSNENRILIVEDNRDVQSYLQTILQSNYQVDLAFDGKEGLEKSLEDIPDLIISDVMMPEMDGFELCDHLKTNELTQHIPVILLTAKAEHEDRLTGISKGADAYINKPFDKRELLLQMEQLLSTRKKLQEYYSKSSNQENDEVEIDPFILKVHAAIDENMSNEEFKTPELCNALFYSKMQVHRKLKAITGMSTSQYLRTYRLKHAISLLAKKDLNISDVCFESGFSSLQYFSRVFKEQYDCSPTQFREKELD